MKNRNLQRVSNLVFFLLTLGMQPLRAQSESPDFMRSTGKIYVVVAVIVTVFIGIVLFLVYLDRKLTKLEDQIRENDQS